ncbi:hypothetical protein DSM3645_01320 [Blastopirellula marina DSM 3645]|uniref:Uncharacterized protein n=1 Tax=Blastopirellula marina DSM 3645 TaxID=314230 RepID=A3ZMY3_9BACT|nr:hypothetical protein DSM3645_01320 [Blastopirellula marina DSM 3645]
MTMGPDRCAIFQRSCQPASDANRAIWLGEKPALLFANGESTTYLCAMSIDKVLGSIFARGAMGNC